MCNKWKALPEFCDVLTMIDDHHRTTSTSTDNITDEAEMNNECMNDENDRNQPIDDTSSEGESMDDNSSGDYTVDPSFSDAQSITDWAADEELIEDEEMNSDENSETVSLIQCLSDFFNLIF